MKLKESYCSKTKDILPINSSTDNNNTKNISVTKSQRSKKIKIKNAPMEENITILTPLPNLNTIFLAGTLLESNQFFRNAYNQSKKKLKLREPTVQLIPFHLQIIKSTIERNKEEAKNDIYGMIKEKEQEIETPYFIDKIEAGQTKVVSHHKEINKDAITQVTLLSDTEGMVLKAGKTEALKEVYIKIKANYMFIYEHKPTDNKIIKHKSVKILNLCYLKYDKSEEDEPVGEGDNEIKRVKKIKNNGKNSLFCFELIFPKKSVKFFVKDQQKFNEFINSIKNIVNYKEISEFEFKEKIGIGKFGIVKRGVHKGTKRKVAIKFIYKEKMTNQDRILLSNEIDILSVVRHPGLINLYEVIDYYDICYIITEYVHGADLYTYVEDKNYKIPEFRIVSIIQQLCCAVYYLNIFGIIHRDIKPEHLLLDDKYEEPTIKLIDFGLSEILFPKEKTCAQFGTIGYTAPEVLRGIPYNRTDDAWTIGIMIYLLIIGCLPFDDANEMNKIKEMTINEEIPFPSVICKKKTQESIYLLENILKKRSYKKNEH